MSPLWFVLAGLVGFGLAVALFARNARWRRTLADRLAPWAVWLPIVGGVAGLAAFFLARLATPPNVYLTRAAAALWAVGVVGGIVLGVAFWHRTWGKLGVLIGAGAIVWIAYSAFREAWIGL